MHWFTESEGSLMSGKSSEVHIVIACGGTGGHFYPTLAVAREFRKRGGKVTLLVSGRHAAEQKTAAENYGIAACEVQAVRLPENFSQVLTFPFQFCRCIMLARKVLRQLRADLLLGMGSFAAVPACLALPGRKLPLVLHEGNAYMGKANRWLAWKASAIALSLPLRFPEQLRGKHSATVGMPLREAIVEAARRKTSPDAYLSEHGLCSGRRTVLIFGGSQGARFINELMLQTLPELTGLRDHLQFIHLTGSDDNQALLAAYQQAGIPALVQRSEPGIERCYCAADLVICRSGASSICELALFGKPLLLIPLPSAADDHQRINAEMLEQAGAARIFPQQQASGKALAGVLADWQEHPEVWLERGQKLLSFAHPDAAIAMVDLLQQVLTVRFASPSKQGS